VKHHLKYKELRTTGAGIVDHIMEEDGQADRCSIRDQFEVLLPVTTCHCALPLKFLQQEETKRLKDVF